MLTVEGLLLLVLVQQLYRPGRQQQEQGGLEAEREQPQALQQQGQGEVG
jgi:hypothetical protein